MTVRLVVRVLTAGVLVLAVPALGGGFPRFGGGCTRADFGAAGTTIRAELCSASSGRDAVVVLHGCGGFSTFDHRLATELPRRGISTLDVDYFGPTPPPGRKGFCDTSTGFASVFPTWIVVASAAARSLRAAGFTHVGAVGWSLGGGVAVAAATLSSRPFEALAGFSTGSFGAEKVAQRLPPTILLSGGRTDAIPLAETLPLYRALRRAHVPAALYVYPHGSHDWPGRQGMLGIAHAATFLRRYLR